MQKKTLLVSAAVAGLALAQPVSAATRSYESLPTTGVQSADSAERVGSISAESEALRGSPVIVIFLIAAIVGALILLANGGSSSPG